MKVTHWMWADVLTKPLHGRAFRLMRSKLMNYSVDSEDQEVSEEKSQKVAVANKGKVKSSKPRPVTGRVSSELPPRHCRSVLGNHACWEQQTDG